MGERSRGQAQQLDSRERLPVGQHVAECCRLGPRSSGSVEASTRIETFVNHARGSSAAELLSAVRQDPAILVTDPTRDLRAFRVAATKPLGKKRGRGRGCFIDSVLDAVDAYYVEVLGSLRAWSAAPPKLRPAHPAPPEVDDTVAAALASTDYSSQDQIPDAAQAHREDARVLVGDAAD